MDNTEKQNEIYSKANDGIGMVDNAEDMAVGNESMETNGVKRSYAPIPFENGSSFKMRAVKKRKAIVKPRQMRRRIRESVQQILQHNILNIDQPCSDNYPTMLPDSIDNECPQLDEHPNTCYQHNLPENATSSLSGNINEQLNSDIDGREQTLMGEGTHASVSEINETDSTSSTATDEENNAKTPDLISELDWSFYENQDAETQESQSFVSHARECLADWALQSNIPRVHVTSLLKCLRNDLQLTYLPVDWRSLLQAKRDKIVTLNMPPGQYHDLGVVPALYGVLERMKASDHIIPNELRLMFNVDGIPISNSSQSEFWPILFKVLDWNDVLVAGIYYGKKKPADMNLYLSAFRDDICQLVTSGIDFQGKTVRVSVSGMSSDSPATTFVLNIVAHNAYYGCRKCTTKGLWVRNLITSSTQAKTGGRITFPELTAPLRSDISFRGRFQPVHHKGNGEKSIVEDILVDVVGDVVLDYLHLVCIGVYKKLVNDWISGKMDSSRFSKESISMISAYRVSIRAYIPTDFARKPRPMDELPRWKATEHRLDLLYICPVAYRHHLSYDKYKHLMLLHVAIKLLVNKDSCTIDAPYADTLLRQFVSSCRIFYGDSFVSFNVHSLIHLANDVIRHGCLDKFSAFPFENKLQILKNLLRKSGRPLQQIIHRLMELDRKNIVSTSTKMFQENLSDVVKVSGPHSCGPIVPEHTLSDQYHKCSWKNVSITTSRPDNCVFVHVNKVVVIKNIVKCPDGEILIIGKRYLKYEDQFKYPLPSSMLNEFLVSDLSNILEVFSLSSVKCKAFRIPSSFPETGNFFVCPLINHAVN